MSSRRLKRRRIETETQPYPEDSETTLQKIQDLAIEDAPEVVEVPQEPQANGADAEASAKEREVWDAFREENYELLEQLPLSLHRAFTLIRELDEQAQENIKHIAPAILKYVSLRKSLAAAARQKTDVAQYVDATNEVSHMEVDGSSEPPMVNGRTPAGSSPSKASATPGPRIARQRPMSVSRSLAEAVQTSTSTRELLIHIAQSAEEVGRASAEKVYLAQHAYDLVDRYCRDLDRAIKEQEASISLGLRPGTHPASIILPEVVVPQSSRGRVVSTPPPAPPAIAPALLPTPAAASANLPKLSTEAPKQPEQPVPIPELGPEPESELGPERESELEHEPGHLESGLPEQEQELGQEPEPQVEPIPAEDIIDVTMDDEQPPPSEPEIPEEPGAPAAPKGQRKGRRRRNIGGRRPTRKATSGSEVVDGTPTEGEGAPTENAQPTLTLRIPAQNLPGAVVDDMPPDPNEPRYCFCNQVSFGDMIACDNPTCPREWFHIGCVGLTRIPKGNWYCRECATLRKRSKSRKRAR